MYKLMIVDDEQIEREGMAQFIPWNKYDIELCGTAWNGLDAFEQIQKNKPDIVLTDIKMPVMNGIELIEKLTENYPEIKIIVLSGYGEYEYTGQAMELGVRHYILKPCDEEKIVTVMNEAKKEVEEYRTNQIKQEEYHTIRRKLLPHAKEEMFRGLFKNRKLSEEEMQLLKEDIPERGVAMKLLAMKNPVTGFEYLEQFILGNILGECLGMKKMPLFTSEDDMVFFLVQDTTDQNMKSAVEKTLQEFARLKTKKITTAVSVTGDISQLKELHAQIMYLFALGEGERNTYLCYPESKSNEEKSTYYFAFDRIRNAKTFDEILFEITIALKKMEERKLSLCQKQKICRAFTMTWKIQIRREDMENIDCEEADEAGLLEDIAVWTGQALGIYQTGKEAMRMQHILTVIYQNIGNTALNIQYMAKNVLFMNEDYFGRIFMRNQNIKFSSYLEQCRIEMAKRLLVYNPDMKIANLTELVGYPQDGQYFSKAFRKVCGKTPSEYKEQLKKIG